MAPRWLKIGLCCLKLAQDAQEGSQTHPKYSKMRPKWLQDGFQIDMFWLPGDFFEICFQTRVFQYFFCISGAGKASILTNFGNKSKRIFRHFGHLGTCMPQEASRLLQDGPPEPIWTQHGTKLAPSWLELGPCWSQVGSNLAQVGPMLAPDPGPQPPLSQPKPFQIPSQALQEPIQEATPRPPGLGSWICSLGSTFWTSQTPNLDLKTARHGSKKDLPRLQILSAQARWLGRSLFICIT